MTMNERGSIIAKAAIAAAERLELTGPEMSRILGISEEAGSRSGIVDAVCEGEGPAFGRAVSFLRIFRSLDTIVTGDEGAARIWVRAPNKALAARPVDLMGTTHGLVEVERYLEGRRPGVCSFAFVQN